MKFTNFLTSTIFAFSIVTIAVFSVQNYTGVSLKLSIFELVKLESIQFPLGVMLAFCFGIGVIFAPVLPLLWQGQKSRQPKSKKRKYRQKREYSQNIPDPLEDW